MQLTLHLEIDFSFIDTTFIACSLNVVWIIKSNDSFVAFLIMKLVSPVMIMFNLDAIVPYTALMIAVFKLLLDLSSKDDVFD